MAENQTPNQPEQEFNAEEFKKLLSLGYTVGKSKLFSLAGKICERVEQEFDPTAKLEKSLKAQYADLVSKGVNPEVAQRVVLETARDMMKKFQNAQNAPEDSGTP